MRIGIRYNRIVVNTTNAIIDVVTDCCDSCKNKFSISVVFSCTFLFFRQNFSFDRMKSGKDDVFHLYESFWYQGQIFFRFMDFLLNGFDLQMYFIELIHESTIKIPRNKTSLRKRSKFLESRFLRWW